MTNDPPRIGEWLRRRDTGRWARVVHIAKMGASNPMSGVPLFVDDVILNYGPGWDTVCSGNAYFWTKWERFDVSSAARTAIATALGQADLP